MKRRRFLAKWRWLEKAFGVSMDLLLQVQAGYDAAQVRGRAGEINVKRFRLIPAR